MDYESERWKVWSCVWSGRSSEVMQRRALSRLVLANPSATLSASRSPVSLPSSTRSSARTSASSTRSRSTFPSTSVTRRLAPSVAVSPRRRRTPRPSRPRRRPSTSPRGVSRSGLEEGHGRRGRDRTRAGKLCHGTSNARVQRVALCCTTLWAAVVAEVLRVHECAVRSTVRICPPCPAPHPSYPGPFHLRKLPGLGHLADIPQSTLLRLKCSLLRLGDA